MRWESHITPEVEKRLTIS